MPSVLSRALGTPGALLVDAGARGGINERWAPYAEVVRALAFDPDEHAVEPAPNVELVPVALGGRAAERTLYVCRLPGCSSLLRPNADALAGFPRALTRSFDVVSQRSVTTRTLDEVLHERGERGPDFLKLDVQGAELEILEGASRTLEPVKLVEVEVELVPLYEGQPLFFDVHAFLAARGFTLIGLRRSSWRRADEEGVARGVAGGQLVHADALYVARHLESAQGARDIAAWSVGLSAYRLHDRLAALLGSRRAAEALGADGAAELLEALAPRLRAPFRLAARALARLHRFHHLTLREWAAALRLPPADDWHDPELW